MPKFMGPISEIPTNDLRALIDRSQTMSDVLIELGVAVRTGGNYRTLKSRCERDGISLDGLRARSKAFQRSKLIPLESIPLDDVLVNGRTCSTVNLKRRLIEAGLIEERCAICGRGPEWNGRELVLILDHINGDSSDNRMQNLRLLCPNCNSQTPTFSGRNKPKADRRVCDSCGRPAPYSKSGLCRSCSSSRANVPKPRPPKDELARLLGSESYVAVARMYGVSDTTVRKWKKHDDEDAAAV